VSAPVVSLVPTGGERDFLFCVQFPLDRTTQAQFLSTLPLSPWTHGDALYSASKDEIVELPHGSFRDGFFSLTTSLSETDPPEVPEDPGPYPSRPPRY